MMEEERGNLERAGQWKPKEFQDERVWATASHVQR